MNTEDITIVVLAGLVAALALLGCFWTSKRASRAFRQGLEEYRAPIVRADDELLKGLQPEWPLNQKRWPSPRPLDATPMSRVRCRAYGRVAADRSRSARYTADVMLIVSAAVLGFQIPDVLREVPKLSGDWIGDSAPDWTLIVSTLGWALALLPVCFGLAGGVIVRAHAEDLELAKNYYERAAKASPQNEFPALQESPARGIGGIWNFFR